MKGESESRDSLNKMKKFESQLYIAWGREECRLVLRFLI